MTSKVIGNCFAGGNSVNGSNTFNVIYDCFSLESMYYALVIFSHTKDLSNFVKSQEFYAHVFVAYIHGT